MAKSKKLLSSLGLKDADSTTKTKKKITKKSRKKSKLAPIRESKKKKIAIKQYIHEKQKRANNPPVGLVTPESDKDMPPKKYSCDPHLDPSLEWYGKSENSDFEVDTVSLHRHERIDPMTIISKVLKDQGVQQQTLFPFFEQSENNLPLREAIEFYKHDQGWSNRLITGDSLLVMNSLLEKERDMEGEVQMIYIDPPYGVKYRSNFQPFVNKKTTAGQDKDEDLTEEPGMIKAFRDTWEFEIHSYLSYLRSRLLLAKKLLKESGSCFVQISDDNLHYVRELMEEIFFSKNFVNMIVFSKTSKGLQPTNKLSTKLDYILWFAKDIKKLKFNSLFEEKEPIRAGFDCIELIDGSYRKLTGQEKKDLSLIPKDSKLFTSADLLKGGPGSKFEIEFEGKKFNSGNRWWGTPKEGLENCIKKNRILDSGSTLRFKRYFSDYPVTEIDNLWIGFGGVTGARYVVETNPKIIQNCILLATDPGDIVFDPTCGSGTAAYVSEQWGRRWITCDTSRIATTLARQRLMTSRFDYYKLKHPEEGITSGFECKEVPHITTSSIANNEIPQTEILMDQPLIDKTKIRISGPFTVEAVPSPIVKSLDASYNESSEIDTSIARTPENKSQQDWRDELLITGVRGKGNQKIEFSRVESHPASRWIHAIGETKEVKPKLTAISFGTEYSPLEQKQVTLAISEAQKLVPTPKLIIFASLQFDPEAAKDIDELQWPGVQVLKVQVNADLLTSDLKKKRASNESFWLMGQPDVELKKQKDEKYIVEVKGFDYYNTKTGEIESGDTSKIAMWMLDTDYDERSLYPQQVFFPDSSGSIDNWTKLTKTLKSEIDEELIKYYSGTKSLPFSVGSSKQVAVKIIDIRGIESLKIIKI